MFTGIIEEVGTISKIVNKGGKKEFIIRCSLINNSLKIGDSVASNGICLTVTKFDNQQITIEAMNETIAKTNIKNWSNLTKINLERAMTMGGRLDGHIVQGHVDTVLNVVSLNKIGDTLYIELNLPDEYKKLVIPQGSVALNGVSLTVAKLTEDSFSVALISLTEELTNLNKLKVNDEVNVEFDVLGKYVQRFLNISNKNNKPKSKITQEWLIENGF